jgi:hypothetical protein
MKPQHFNKLIIALSIHIFSVHCRLLYYLNPEITTKPPFSFLNIDEATVLAMVFALSYSVGTAFVIFISKKRSLILIYGIIDTIGVLLYYFTSIPIHYGAIYFALYTGILISSTMFLNGPEYLADQILEMKEKGITQREAAERLNISESKVSRVLKRTKHKV